MTMKARTATLLIAIAITLAVTNGTLAHDGHAHHESGGMLGGVVEIAGVAAGLVIVYVLATWYFRYRDR